jgi:hypothetical protein
MDNEELYKMRARRNKTRVAWLKTHVTLYCYTNNVKKELQYSTPAEGTDKGVCYRKQMRGNKVTLRMIDH